MTDTLKKAEELISRYGKLKINEGKSWMSWGWLASVGLCKSYETEKQLLSLISDLVEENEKYKSLAEDIHYPEAWDNIGGYPTLFDALKECVAPFRSKKIITESKDSD